MCGCLLHTPSGGTRPATQARALTGNRTSNRLVRRLVLNPLSHTSQTAQGSLSQLLKYSIEDLNSFHPHLTQMVQPLAFLSDNTSF